MNWGAEEAVINNNRILILQSSNQGLFTRKSQKIRYELIAAVVTRKDVHGGSADLQRHMMFSSGREANQVREEEKRGNG